MIDKKTGCHPCEEKNDWLRFQLTLVDWIYTLLWIKSLCTEISIIVCHFGPKLVIWIVSYYFPTRAYSIYIEMETVIIISAWHWNECKRKIQTSCMDSVRIMNLKSMCQFNLMLRGETKLINCKRKEREKKHFLFEHFGVKNFIWVLLKSIAFADSKEFSPGKCKRRRSIRFEY